MRSRVRIALVSAAAVATTLVSACTGGSGGSGGGSSTTVTFAEGAGSAPTYIFPMYDGADSGNNNITYLQPLMWRPLYWFGHSTNDEPTINDTLSLADKPQMSNNGKTVTITLRRYMWSDGTMVTTRDVQFWMNLLLANRIHWGLAAPNDWSTHIVKMTFPNAHTFTITFDQVFNSAYLLDSGLSQITPIPQQAWDKTSSSAAIGNYDMTKQGAKAVYTFLDKQSRNLPTWDTNPLWQVVDGPWRLEPKDGFQTTGQTILIPNRKYSGPIKPKIARFEELPFTSASAEFNAVSSGKVDYGYLPFSDVPQIARFKSQGSRVEPWLDWGFTLIGLNFNHPKAGAFFDQLYIRQAMQHLINQQGYIKEVLKGYGVPTYGPVPVQPPNPFLSPQEKQNPYPYSISTAKQLLATHGWRLNGSSAAVCASPGTGANECGKGIVAGAKLAMTMTYSSGSDTTDAEMQLMRSDFLKGGIDLTVVGAPFNTTLSAAYDCQTKPRAQCPSSSTQLSYIGSPSYTYVPVYYPSGETLFQTGGGTNSGAYSDPTNDANVKATHTEGGYAAMFRYENYLSRQLPALWFPNNDYQISVIAKHLNGIVAQDSTGHIYPEDWTISSH